MGKWERERKKLQELIDNGVSYEDIGRAYGCTGANIKKQAKLLGIKLKVRRKINQNETFNRKKNEKRCENCGAILNSSRGKYCSQKCQNEHRQKTLIEKWKKGEINGSDVGGNIREFVRRYLLEKNGSKCERCGFGKVNEYTGLPILQIHHKDGDCFNNSEENLELLCPNCHCLTENFGSRNKNATRTDKRTKYYRDLILQSH